jgi:hypothetical protein
MDYSGIIPQRMLVPADLDSRRPIRRLQDWVAESRAHRVICMLAGLWVINLFDLALTLLAHEQGMLVESNPVARKVLSFGPQAVAVFKLTLVGGASAVLIYYRWRVLAEVTAAAMLLIYAIVAVRWRLCYELYSLTMNGDASATELERIDAWAGGIPLL